MYHNGHLTALGLFSLLQETPDSVIVLDDVSAVLNSQTARFLVQECNRLDILPDVRLLVDKAFQDYLSWKLDNTETHWKDLITSSLKEQLVDPKHRSAKPKSRKEEVDEERRIVKLRARWGPAVCRR